ncbi:hypothetical protein MSAN_00378300 [Mycena sanguinolenta]|uniref:Uncharacterized protein n=1 Tax=Mycena sanguinolenta TaxID=230812 RepID=A0A8H7DIW3_9AGAR|nr:hypothetical protein MSAN_00378300 [Mycena sanguinolenta]
MDDDASLFGSPPSTPTRGRSPSPVLALPNVSANIINLSSSSAQNVGTIALPGSHNFSELPVNPLALSLSYPTPQNGDALRPPAQMRDGFMTQVRPRNAVSAPTVLPDAAPSVLEKKRPTRKPRAQTQANAPRPTPPPILLPDPSHPMPLNLLRNQPALLGTAGVVAGVRPAHLPVLGQGMTSTNPIFVEDEPPSALPLPKPRLKAKAPPGVDIASLPPPNNQDIIRMLISQHDIFPLLESILKFIAAIPPCAASETPSSSGRTGDSRSRSNTPANDSAAPKKRRKLRHVPAGAHLWDVPFPFDEGEGPAAYRDEWEKDRGKTLMAELIKLIKDAAKKAALKNYLEKQKTHTNAPTDAQLASLSKYYRVETLFYDKTPETEVFADASNTSLSSASHHTSSPASSSIIPSDSSSNPTPFDQLITSLLSASSSQRPSSNGDSSSFSGFFDTSAPLDTSLFNSWMDILQAFPMPAEGFTPDFKSEDLAIDPRQTFLTVPESLANPMQYSTPSPAMPSFDFTPDFAGAFSEASTVNANTDFSPTTLDDLMRDPVPMGPFSIPPIDTDVGGSMSNFTDSGCPSLVGSPIPSASSSSFGSMTPTETRWNGDPSIGIFSPGEGERFPTSSRFPTPGTEPHPNAQPCVASTSQGKKRDFGEMSGWTDAEREALSFMEVLSKSKLGSRAKGKEG